MLAELPLLFTTLAYILSLGVVSSFHPIVPGVIFCTAPSDVMISAITPVPGGVGPMTVCALIENTVIAAERLSR